MNMIQTQRAYENQLEGDPDLRPDAAEAGPAVSATIVMKTDLPCPHVSSHAWRRCSPRALALAARLNPRAAGRRAPQPTARAPEPAIAAPAVSNGAIFQAAQLPAAVRGPPRAPGRRHAHGPDRREDQRQQEHELASAQDRQASRLGITRAAGSSAKLVHRRERGRQLEPTSSQARAAPSNSNDLHRHDHRRR